jgi:hypothetical protein
VIAILLNAYEGGEEPVGANCPECEAIAEPVDEKRRNPSELRDGGGRSEADRVKAGRHEHPGVESQPSEGREHLVAAVHAGPRGRPLAEELRLEEREGSHLGQGVET